MFLHFDPNYANRCQMAPHYNSIVNCIPYTCLVNSRISSQMHAGIHVRYLTSTDFNQTFIRTTGFNKYPQHHTSRQSGQWEPSRWVEKETETNLKLRVGALNKFANALSCSQQGPATLHSQFLCLRCIPT